jgi:hypothetical protein
MIGLQRAISEATNFQCVIELLLHVRRFAHIDLSLVLADPGHEFPEVARGQSGPGDQRDRYVADHAEILEVGLDIEDRAAATARVVDQDAHIAQRLRSASARSRATRSVGPPAANGTMMVMGRSPGKSAACAAAAAKPSMRAGANNFNNDFMEAPSD